MKRRYYFIAMLFVLFLPQFPLQAQYMNAENSPRLLMCYSKPWVLADTAAWSQVYNRLDVLKIYIGDIGSRIDTATTMVLLRALHSRGIRIAIELGGLLDWHADKGQQSAEYSFAQEFTSVKPLIDQMKRVDPAWNIEMLDMDGPIRRMLFPDNSHKNYHTIASATDELMQVVSMWRDSIPGIEINLLTNFPNWGWGATPAYFAIDGYRNGYGQYDDVLQAVAAKSAQSGVHLDGLTIDNPYDYALGLAQTNQPAAIAGVDWFRRIDELRTAALQAGLKVNMIFNTNGARTPAEYSVQTLEFIQRFHKSIGIPDGYWIQSWYQLPNNWLPETTSNTMTNIVLNSIPLLANPDTGRALLEPEDGRVYHGAQRMTFASASDPLAGYLGALNDNTIQPAVRGLFFSIPGTRGPANSLKELADFYHSADSIGYIPELSLFMVGNTATDSVIAVSNQYDWILDSIAVLSKSYGKRMFLRIGGEFNGAGPGWNGGGYHPHYYVTMFRKVVGIFETHGMRDSVATIWCYEPDAPDSFDSSDASGYLWYPGDAYVDWFGLDVFDSEHFDQSLPNYNRGVITRKGKSERFLAYARSNGLPVYMSETSAIRTNITSDASDGINDWNSWFAKFWHFIDLHPEIKGFSYIDANWPANAYPGWGDARIENSATVSGLYSDEMRKPKYIHLPMKTPTSIDAGAATIFPGRALYCLPHPVHDVATVVYTIPRGGAVSIQLYTIHGTLKLDITKQWDGAGTYIQSLPVNHLPPGVYVCRITGGGGTNSIRIIKPSF